MLTLSRRIPTQAIAHTVTLADKARRMQAGGIDVAFLTSGEPDAFTPRHVKEAAIKAIEGNATKYSPSRGDPELLQAVAKKFSRDNDLHFEPEQILISGGARQSLFNALQAVCNKGDEVVLVAPHCPDYPAMVNLAGATPVVVRTEPGKGFLPDARDIRKALHPKTKALILNSPNNPSGAVYPRSLLEEIAAMAKDSGIFVISDEVYEKILLDDVRHFSIGSLRSIRDQVITVNGASMPFAMSGWRVGYMGAPGAVIGAAAAFQSLSTFSPNSIAQKAALAALAGPTGDLEEMVAEFKRRRRSVVDALSLMADVGVVLPAGAFFLFLNMEKFLGRKHGNRLVKSSADLAEALLEDHHVATLPGSAFGDDRCLRISLAHSPAELERGMRRMKAGLDALRGSSKTSY